MIRPLTDPNSRLRAKPSPSERHSYEHGSPSRRRCWRSTPAHPPSRLPLDPGLSPAVAAAVRNEPDARPHAWSCCFRSTNSATTSPACTTSSVKGASSVSPVRAVHGSQNAHHDHYPLKNLSRPRRHAHRRRIPTRPASSATAGGTPPPAGPSNRPAERPRWSSADAKSKKPAGPANLEAPPSATSSGARHRRTRPCRLHLAQEHRRHPHGPGTPSTPVSGSTRPAAAGSAARPTAAPARSPRGSRRLNDEREIPPSRSAQRWECSLTPQTINERTTTPRFRVSQALPKAFGTAFPHAIGAKTSPKTTPPSPIPPRPTKTSFRPHNAW